MTPNDENSGSGLSNRQLALLLAAFVVIWFFVAVIWVYIS